MIPFNNLYTNNISVLIRLNSFQDEVFQNCAKVSGLNSLKDFQRDCIKNLICGNDVFVCCKTGSDKSTCFEAYPTALRMFSSNRDSGVIVLIIGPLISIISQSVEKMIFD